MRTGPPGRHPGDAAQRTCWSYRSAPSERSGDYRSPPGRVLRTPRCRAEPADLHGRAHTRYRKRTWSRLGLKQGRTRFKGRRRLDRPNAGGDDRNPGWHSDRLIGDARSVEPVVLAKPPIQRTQEVAAFAEITALVEQPAELRRLGKSRGQEFVAAHEPRAWLGHWRRPATRCGGAPLGRCGCRPRPRRRGCSHHLVPVPQFGLTDARRVRDPAIAPRLMTGLGNAPPVRPAGVRGESRGRAYQCLIEMLRGNELAGMAGELALLLAHVPARASLDDRRSTRPRGGHLRCRRRLR